MKKTPQWFASWIQSILALVKRPISNNSLEEINLIDDIIDKLDKKTNQTKPRNSGFVRKLRDNGFEELNRRCKQKLWDKLIELATTYLTAKYAAKGYGSKTNWSQEDIGKALAGVDKSAISNAMKGVPASITIERLFAALLNLEQHWAALGELPPFEDLRTECLLNAIAFAQRSFNTHADVAPPLSDRPTSEQLALLMKIGFPDDSAPDNYVPTWNEWGIGWLIAKRKLGLTRGVGDGTK